MTNPRSKLARFRYMRRWRKRICIGFLPTGFALMVLLQIVLHSSFLLVWPALLLYTLGTVIWLGQLDVCPWCRQSFHSADRSGGKPAGFATLWRDQCANCGEPKPAPNS